MFLLLLYFCIALTASFMCSLLEAVLLSVTPSHVELLLKTGHRSGRILKKIRDNLDRPLAAILTVNTMSHTVGAAGVGAQAQKLWGDDIIAITSAVLTFLILFLSEILPKTIGVAYWKKFAPTCAYLMQGMVFATYPLVLFFDVFSKWITKGKSITPKISREEMIIVAELGHKEGALVEKEARVIRNLLQLNNIFVKDVMTPKGEVFSLFKNQTVEDVMEKHGEEFYSRIPVYDKTRDDIIGVVLRFNIFNAESDGLSQKTMEELMLPIHKVRTTQSLAQALDEFVQCREHLFLVLDENDSMAGLITLEDVIETLLGVEIEDEIDNAEAIRERTIQAVKERVRFSKQPVPGKRAAVQL